MIDQIKNAFHVLTGSKVATERKPGITIHNMEITVSSNQAPNQIAKDVFEALARDRRLTL